LHLAGSVPEFICLPADCCLAEDSSDDESVSVRSMDCSDTEPPFELHLDDNVSSTEDDKYPSTFAKHKIQITYDDNSFVSTNTATTADATYSDASVGNASIASEECFAGRGRQASIQLQRAEDNAHKT